MVKVYAFTSHNIMTDQSPVRRWATLEFIKSKNLIPITQDMLEVPQSSLDSEGRYIEKEAKQ